MSILGLGLGLSAMAAIAAGFFLAGPRGAAIVAALLALLWVAERVDASYTAEAEAARVKSELAKAEAAYTGFRAASDKAAKSAAAQIMKHRVAAATAEAALAAAQQRIDAQAQALKERIAIHVPARPQCDYSQPVLDGLRDAHRAAVTD